MQISLRKAHSILKQLKEQLVKNIVVTSISLEPFENVVKALDKATHDMHDKIMLVGNLTDVQHRIREAVGYTNARSGVDNLLTKKAYLEAQLAFTAKLAASTEATAVSVLQARLTKAENAVDNFYGNTVSTSLLTAEDIKSFKNIEADLKREIEAVNERLQVLNLSENISISDSDVQLLEDLHIL